jgi:hypothetical protein
MPRRTKRALHLASIAQAGVTSKRLKSTSVGEDQAFLSEYEEDSDDQWDVDESGDSDVSSNSDDDNVINPYYT